MAKKLNEKAKTVKQYEKNCPINIRGYVVGIIEAKYATSWSFQELSDEFGIAYMRFSLALLHRYQATGNTSIGFTPEDLDYWVDHTEPKKEGNT